MSYLSPYLSGREINIVVKNIERLFDPVEHHFDTIAVRGNSGLLLGSVLAARWDRKLIIVRKEENCHSSHLVEGWGRQQNILIVDDFKESGETINTICDRILEKCDSPKFYGVLLYAGTHKDSYFQEEGLKLECGYYLDLWNIQREC